MPVWLPDPLPVSYFFSPHPFSCLILIVILILAIVTHMKSGVSMTKSVQREAVCGIKLKFGFFSENIV